MIPLALPGVGRYIAGAIFSFAFNRPEPIVEANSQRVLARLLAISENLKTASTLDAPGKPPRYWCPPPVRESSTRR